MPRCDWFYPIKLTSRKQRENDAESKRATRGVKRFSFYPPLSSYARIRECSSQSVYIGGLEIKLYSLTDLAGIYFIAPSTTMRWYANDMLPQPFTYKNVLWQQEYLRGHSHVPLYAHGQILAICKVLDDLFEQGYRHFRRDHTKHQAMMWAGSQIALNRIPFRAHAKFQKLNASGEYRANLCMEEQKKRLKKIDQASRRRKSRIEGLIYADIATSKNPRFAELFANTVNR